MKSIKTNKSNSLLLLIAILLGVTIGSLYLSFEWIVNNGTNWIWNNLAETDTYRWRVIPLAIILSIALTMSIKVFNKKRIVPPATNLISELNDIKQTNIKDILIILIIGLISLLAGASLGPEASLVGACMGIAAWISGKLNVINKPTALVLSLASLGALLAGFFNSLLPILIPLLILKKINKLSINAFAISLLTGGASWLIVKFIKNEAYIEVPVNSGFSFINFGWAFVLGLASILLTILIKAVIKYAFPLAKKLDDKLFWFISAIAFGLGLGILYFIGGPTVQFSGSEGLKLLSSEPLKYGISALAGLIIVKIFATSWSAATGYRGGFVFPSIYIGVVFSLLIVTLFGLSTAEEAGTTVGAITGILMGMINPIIGIILALALFPFEQYYLVLGAGLGAFLSLKLTIKLLPKESNSNHAKK